MMTRFLALAALVTSSVAAAAAPAARQPTGKWIVNFADAQCIATRNYGTVESPLQLVLKVPPLGNVLQIGIVRNGQLNEARQLDGEIVFHDTVRVRTNVLEYGVRSLGQRALLINLPAQNLDRLRAASIIRIRAKTRIDERFQITQMADILKILDACATDLRRVWHITDGSSGSPLLKQEASGNLKGIIESEDYPDVALWNNQSGAVALVLLIDEHGRVADCTVTETSGVATLDAQSCAIIRERARFKPAVGLDGKPAKGAWFQRINWRVAF